MHCAAHPNTEAKYFCAKYNRYLCEACRACADPTLYCKHRTSCLIWEVDRHGTPDQQQEQGEASGSES